MKPLIWWKNMTIWQELDYTSSLIWYPDYVHKFLFEYNMSPEEVIQILEMDDSRAEDIWDKEIRDEIDSIINIYSTLLWDNWKLVNNLRKKWFNRYETLDILRKKTRSIFLWDDDEF